MTERSPEDGWADHPGPLPTAAGMSTGVVKAWPKDESGRSRAAVQCSVCFRTFTTETFWAVKMMNFAPDDGAIGATKYRRCRDCRDSKRHPEET